MCFPTACSSVWCCCKTDIRTCLISRVKCVAWTRSLFPLLRQNIALLVSSAHWLREGVEEEEGERRSRVKRWRSGGRREEGEEVEEWRKEGGGVEGWRSGGGEVGRRDGGRRGGGVEE